MFQPVNVPSMSANKPQPNPQMFPQQEAVVQQKPGSVSGQSLMPHRSLPVGNPNMVLSGPQMNLNRLPTLHQPQQIVSQSAQKQFISSSPLPQMVSQAPMFQVGSFVPQQACSQGTMLQFGSQGLQQATSQAPILQMCGQGQYLNSSSYKQPIGQANMSQIVGKGQQPVVSQPSVMKIISHGQALSQGQQQIVSQAPLQVGSQASPFHTESQNQAVGQNLVPQMTFPHCAPGRAIAPKPNYQIPFSIRNVRGLKVPIPRQTVGSVNPVSLPSPLQVPLLQQTGGIPRLFAAPVSPGDNFPQPSQLQFHSQIQSQGQPEILSPVYSPAVPGFTPASQPSTLATVSSGMGTMFCVIGQTPVPVSFVGAPHTQIAPQPSLPITGNFCAKPVLNRFYEIPVQFLYSFEGFNL